MAVLGPVLTALGAALAAWVLRQLIELTCAPWLDVCMRSSQLLAFVYSAILIVLGIIAYLNRAALGAQFGVFVPVLQQLYRTAVASAGGAAAGAAGDKAAADAPPPAAERSVTAGSDATRPALRQRRSARKLP